MKIKTIFLIFLATITVKEIQAQSHQIAISTTGVYFFNDYKNIFNPGYRQQFYPSVAYQYQQKKIGLQASVINYYNQYHHLLDENDTSGVVYSRTGVVLNLSLLYELKEWKTGNINALGGFSTKFSKESNDYKVPGSGAESGLAVNFGFNLNQKIYKRLYFTSNLRSVNFLFGTETQKNAIWFENALGYRFGKK